MTDNMVFYLYDKDIAKIKEWSEEHLVETERQAKNFVNKDFGNWFRNPQVRRSIVWANHVIYKCDDELMNRGLREETESRKLLKSFFEEE